MSEHDPSRDADLGHPIFDDDPATDGEEDVAPAPREAGHRRRRRRSSGCLPLLLVAAIVITLAVIFVPKGLRAVKDHFADPADYPGPGTGRVTFEIDKGDSARTVGQELKDDGVVASVEAFTDAVSASPDDLQSGIFVLQKQMKASDAVDILTQAKNDKSINLTILPGKTVDETIKLLAQNTPFSLKDYQKALDDPDALGLPSYADGKAEGYLYPGHYLVGPDDTATTVLKAMVSAANAATEKAGLVDGAKKLGYTPEQIMTVASLLQAEGRADVQAKIARVIYNRLEIPGNPSAGFLQVDATVNFALGVPNIARLTQAQIDSVADNPYNTYKQKGLPPGPIESPESAAIDAALHPADGPWFFYVTVNLKTGETKFTDSPEQFLEFKNELNQYCATQSDRC